MSAANLYAALSEAGQWQEEQAQAAGR